MTHAAAQPVDQRLETTRRALVDGKLLESIEIAVWLIFVVLVFWWISAAFQERKADQADKVEPNWNVVVEREYDTGNYQQALEALASHELILTHSASSTCWQRRCC